jgi:photosystem II stability/assembly factor-like uncharacterized protein
MSRTSRRSAGVIALSLVIVTGVAGVSGAAPEPDIIDRGSVAVTASWQLTPTGAAARYRGLSAVSDRVAWVGGLDGTAQRTRDGGATWTSVGPPDASTLQFRDVEATSDGHAVLLAAGLGDASRIYVTDDGGTSWSLAFRNDDAQANYDCLAFSTPDRGLAVSDPVDGAFRLQETLDGGHTWSLVDPSGMPAARANEFALAASGSCLSAGPGQPTYLAAGGDNPQRIYRSRDHGHTWTTSDAPLAVGPSAGAFAVRFADRDDGIAVGGDVANPTSARGNAAWSDDGGVTWRDALIHPSGYRSGAAWVGGHPGVAVAVGPGGSDVSTDSGRTWSSFDSGGFVSGGFVSGGFDTVDCAPDGACWASGAQGRVARLVVNDR